jgi:tRNA(Ile)-lysidine synthase
MKLQQAIIHSIRTHKLITVGETVVVAVSGGADSLALLHILHHIAPVIGFPLHVATLDHGLRGAESADDARFVSELAQHWGLPCTQGYTPLSEGGAKQANIEARARQARYAFLAQVAHDVGATKIVLAHHADDQAETILMRLLRGAGLRGLVGMRAMSAHPFVPDLTLVRPFLAHTRAEIEAYCQEHDLQPRHDSSNDDLRYLRNRLRKQVLPLLHAHFPQVERSLTRLGESAAVDEAFIQTSFVQTALPHLVRNAHSVAAPIAMWRLWHPALQRRAVQYAVEMLGGADDLDYEHILKVLALAQHKRA